MLKPDRGVVIPVGLRAPSAPETAPPAPETAPPAPELAPPLPELVPPPAPEPKQGEDLDLAARNGTNGAAPPAASLEPES
jgi:hypothetical protein